MDSSRQALLIGHLLQQPAKLGAFFCAERRKQSILVLPHNLANTAKDLPAVRSQME